MVQMANWRLYEVVRGDRTIRLFLSHGIIIMTSSISGSSTYRRTSSISKGITRSIRRASTLFSQRASQLTSYPANKPAPPFHSPFLFLLFPFPCPTSAYYFFFLGMVVKVTRVCETWGLSILSGMFERISRTCLLATWNGWRKYLGDGHYYITSLTGTTFLVWIQPCVCWWSILRCIVSNASSFLTLFRTINPSPAYLVELPSWVAE